MPDLPETSDLPEMGVPSLGAAALVAFLLGAAGLIVEIAIVRAAAPWFGQGTHVWANAIGVVLLALAAGAALGGRWADRDPSGSAVPFALAAAALLVAAGSRLVGPLAAWLVPVDVAADRPLPLSFWGSLALTTIVAGPPLVVLGAVPPLLVRRSASEAGRAAAAVSAAGTLGGLAACAVTASILVPSLGSRATLGVAALATAAAAVVEACRRASPLRATSPTLAGRNDETASPGGGRPARIAGVAVAALVGLAAVIAEFAAFRALTPVCGGTNGDYAAVIAAVLLALAGGNAVGGRARTARGDARLVAAALAAATAGFAVAPTVAAMAGRAVGPFLGALAGFGVPVAMIGTACPVLVRRRAAFAGSGRAAGAIFATATVASLVACYATPLLLLPDLGVRWTSGVAGAASLLAAALALVALRGPEQGSTGPDAPPPSVAPAGERTSASWRALAVASVGALAGLAAILAPAGPLRVDPGQLAEIETAYQTVRLAEAEEPVRWPGKYPPLFGDMKDVRTRFLRFDEDSFSYQSLRLLDGEPSVLTAGRYYDHLALGAWFVGMPWTRPAGDPRVLIVGYCGGTLHRVLALGTPAGRAGPEVVGVELDPAVSRLARARLGDFPPRLTLFEGADGRRVVDDLPRDSAFDLVLVDAYQRTQYVPFQLATREFFRACADRLAPQGAVGVNVNAPGGLSGALLAAVAATMGDAVGRDNVWLVSNLEYPTNVVVWGTRDGAPPRVGARSPESLATPRFTLERFLVRATPSGTVLTDDRAPVERLADRDLLPLEEAR